MRIDEIEVKSTGHTDTDGNYGDLKIKQTSTKDLFFDPKIRRAAWVGCALSVFQ